MLNALFGIMDVPTWLGSTFNMSGLVADAFSGIIFVVLFLGLVLLFKSNKIIVVIVSVLLLGPLTALGWFPYWCWVIFGVWISWELAQKYKDGL